MGTRAAAEGRTGPAREEVQGGQEHPCKLVPGHRPLARALAGRGGGSPPQSPFLHPGNSWEVQPCRASFFLGPGPPRAPLRSVLRSLCALCLLTDSTPGSARCSRAGVGSAAASRAPCSRPPALKGRGVASPQKHWVPRAEIAPGGLGGS